jgi:hypothetical protein
MRPLHRLLARSSKYRVIADSEESITRFIAEAYRILPWNFRKEPELPQRWPTIFLWMAEVGLYALIPPSNFNLTRVQSKEKRTGEFLEPRRDTLPFSF